MKKILILLGLQVFSLVSFSQKNVSLYTFEETIGTYTSISSTGSIITPSDWDDGCSSAIAIGFDFNYNETIYNLFSVNTNGTINIGGNNYSPSTNNLTSTTYNNLIAPLWDDLIFRNPGNDEGLFYLLEGTSENKVLTIEFCNVGRYMNIAEGTSVGTASFQVKLFEEDNHIEIIYGDLSGTSDWSVNSTSSIGINANTEGNLEFLSVTPNSETGATVSYITENNAITPDELGLIEAGATYKFSPPNFIDDFDIQLESISLPTNGFLDENELVKITFLNLGAEILTGLQFKYEIFDIETSSSITSFTEDFSNYPVSTGTFYDFEFYQHADLSENKIYEIEITAILTDDINPENNVITSIIKGVIIGNELFSNALLITHPGAGFDGADVSAVQQDLGLIIYGENANDLIGFKNADDFTVPQGEKWEISGFGFYNFQTGSTTESTINYGAFRIWDEIPSNTGTPVIDSTEQNMLSGSIWSGIYRSASNDLFNTERPIMHNICNFYNNEKITLFSGTYWIDFTCDGTLGSGPYQPYVTIYGETNTGNGMHLGYEGWVPMKDDGGVDFFQGMPFEVYGNSFISSIETTENKINLYPNPCNDFINIETSFKSFEINIYNLIGTKIYTSVNYSNNAKLNTTNFKKSIYFIEIASDKNKYIEKFIVN